MTQTRPRKPWIAGLLSMLAPGLGQIYNGQLNRGLCFTGLFLAIEPISQLIVMTVPLAPLNVVVGALLWVSAFLYILTDSVKTARTKRLSYQLQVYNKWYVYLVAILVVPLAVDIITEYALVKSYKIPNGSMIPTLEIGDRILVNKLTYGIRAPTTRSCLALCRSPARGDVVDFIFPEDRTKGFIKRVIGIGGDTVEIRDKKVYVNDQAIDDPYAYFESRLGPGEVQIRDDYGPKQVPDKQIFVLGDNRDKSYDSRFWGSLDVNDVKGKAVVIYWSWDSSAGKIRWERIGKPVN